MKHPQKIKNHLGFTLTEIIVTLGIIGILLAVGAPELGGRLRRLWLNDCAHKLAADVMHAKAAATANGRRGMLMISPDTALHDFDGNGSSELWLTYLDSKSSPNGKFDTGETSLSCSTCSRGLIIENNTNPLPLSSDSTFRYIGFSLIGTVKPDTAINDSIVMTNSSDNHYKVRIKFISLTGAMQIQACDVTSTVDCTADSNWHDI